MSIRRAWPYALVGVALWWYWTTQQQASQAEGALRVRDSIVQARVVQADSLIAAVERVQQEAAEALRRGNEAVREQERRAAAAAGREVRLRDSLRAAVPDSLVPLLDAMAAEDSIVDFATDSIIAVLHAHVSRLLANARLETAARHALRQALDEALAQRDAWQRQARGGRIRLFYGPGAAAILSDGVVRLGPGLVVGLSIKLR